MFQKDQTLFTIVSAKQQEQTISNTISMSSDVEVYDQDFNVMGLD